MATEQTKENTVIVNDNDIKKKRGRRNMPFASICASECIIVPESVWKFASGQKIRRITLFDQLGKSPDSGTSRSMITASSKYGFTTGGYQAEFLELTSDGYKAFNPEEDPKVKLQSLFKLVIEGNDYFMALYEKYKGVKLPIKSVIIDYLGEIGLEEEFRETGAELFIENAKFIGLVKLLSGAERIISIEQALEEVRITSITSTSTGEVNYDNNLNDTETNNTGCAEYDKVCFYIAPIGSADSEERQHSDLFLESIVSPAFEKFGYNVIRADKIGKPGLITNQIIDYIMNSAFVVCDLSFHNPNAFYELALRHATKKPTIHIIRKRDNIPFDINDFRTIVIDDTSIYTLIPALESYKNQIAQQIRQMIEDPDAIDNPIMSYLDKNKKAHL